MRSAKADAGWVSLGRRLVPVAGYDLSRHDCEGLRESTVGERPPVVFARIQPILLLGEGTVGELCALVGA